MKRCDRLISSALKLCSPFQKGNPIWFEIYWKENQQKKGRRVPPSGFDALMMASYFGLERVVEEFLAVKCLKTWFETSLRISSRDISFGRSALSWATCNGHGCVVKLLLHQVPKAEVKLRDWFPGLSTCVNAKDGNGIAPLSIALGYGYPEIAGQLIKKGAKIEAKDNYQRTSLALAARWGYRDITQLLLEKGADIKTRDKHQMTPLAIATAWGYRDIIQLLLEKGADIEARDEDQRTPLAIATVRGYMKQNIDIIQLLLENGADIEARDKDQMTPLALAAAYGYIGQNTDTIQLLLEKGADIKARDKDQMTPLEVATALGHRDMIQLLLDKGIGTERPSR
jgi:ankyrin repeat protein